MNDFLLGNLRKFDKLSAEQARAVFARTLDDMGRYEAAFNSIRLGLLVCDEKHRLSLTNASAERYLGITRYDKPRAPLWRLLKDEAVSAFLREALESGDGAEGRCFSFKAPRAPFRLLSFDVLPLVEEYRITGALIVVEDVTQKKARETELRRIESLASLTTLAAGVAHEIKNPLASLSIHVHLLQKTLCGGGSEAPFESGKSIEDRLDIVNEEIGRLNRIVVDFLFAVRPMDVTLLRSDVNGLVRETVALVECELEGAGIACVVDLQKKVPLVEFDEKYMKQALLNLVKNAMEAMRDSAEKVLAIKTEAADSELTISVSDTGCGISEENKPKIFEPYFTTKEMGTGIGLTMVFKIVREHRGRIRFESKEGEGTAFAIVLPIPQTATRLLEWRRE